MNLWDHYRGQIVYLVLESSHLERLISSSNDPILGFEFGDSFNGINKVKPNSIEALSLMFYLIQKEAPKLRNFIVADAYIMQSYSKTFEGKGAAIKGFLSSHRHRVQRLNQTLIFSSETIDHTLGRNFSKFR